MPRLSIVLPREEHQALCDLALREWREPREQAGYLITESLKRICTKEADSSSTLTTSSPDPRSAP